MTERSTDLEAAKPQIPYTPPAGVLLNPVSGNFPFTCHASQNWSAEGALRNRDASVIIENEKAAKYYEQIFLHDWDRIAKQTVQQ